MSRTATMDAIAHDEATRPAGNMDRRGRFRLRARDLETRRRNMEARRRWIVTTLVTAGGVNRTHIMEQFKVCRSVARDDIKSLYAAYPDVLAYDGGRRIHHLTRPADEVFLPVLNIQVVDSCQ